MASGHDHDRATLLACIPFGLLLLPLMGPQAFGAGAGAFLVGGLWLSPDLDTASKPLHRWGPLRWIWWPYQRLVPHRSLLSHGPLIGMGLRLLWLLTCVLLSWMLLRSLLLMLQGATPPGLELTPIQALIRRLVLVAQDHPRPLIATALGLEASVWLHLLLDGDPLPVEWHRHLKRSRMRRRDRRHRRRR